MVRKVLCFLIGFISLLGFSSCSDQDEIVYSCDDAVDLWVKGNISEIQSMTRTSWKVLPAEKNVQLILHLRPSRRLLFGRKSLQRLWLWIGQRKSWTT